jgi:hypothetical protein
VVTVQFPTQPFFSVNVAATWAGLSFTMQGAISTTDIQFTGNAPGPWTISHGSTPVVVSNMLLTFDHTFSPAATTGAPPLFLIVPRGAVTYGTWPTIEGIMKYPADSESQGCFSLTVIIGAPSAGPGTLDGLVSQAVGTSNSSANFPADTHDLFGTALQAVTLSVYPDCGALYVDAQLATQSLGTVDVGFALFEFAPVSGVLAAFAQGLPDDPPVPIGGGSSFTVGAREALASLADAFEGVTPPLLVPQAHIVRQPVGHALQTVMVRRCTPLYAFSGVIFACVVFVVAELPDIATACRVPCRRCASSCWCSSRSTTSRYAVLFLFLKPAAFLPSCWPPTVCLRPLLVFSAAESYLSPRRSMHRRCCPAAPPRFSPRRGTRPAPTLTRPGSG